MFKDLKDYIEEEYKAKEKALHILKTKLTEEEYQDIIGYMDGEFGYFALNYPDFLPF